MKYVLLLTMLCTYSTAHGALPQWFPHKRTAEQTTNTVNIHIHQEQTGAHNEIREEEKPVQPERKDFHSLNIVTILATYLLRHIIFLPL